MAERNAVRHGNELWFYNSKDNTAAHAQLPADGAGHADRRPGPEPVPTPEELAGKLLAKLDPSTDVTVGAGRPGGRAGRLQPGAHAQVRGDAAGIHRDRG